MMQKMRFTQLFSRLGDPFAGHDPFVAAAHAEDPFATSLSSLSSGFGASAAARSALEFETVREIFGLAGLYFEVGLQMGGLGEELAPGRNGVHYGNITAFIIM